jgi:integrase
MMWLGAVLGFRWAEAAGLTVGAIDFRHKTVSVTHQLARGGQLVSPKSAASTRTLACPDWLLDDLEALVKRRGLNQTDSGALLFVDGGGTPLDYSNRRRRT